ncbi:MAG: hypothetical protein LBT89_01295 [Planctomycetaceae bacterium]|jgi:hypothetical protein|nr:hypothetical protein [Planctomycetaceae bacterium]
MPLMNRLAAVFIAVCLMIAGSSPVPGVQAAEPDIPDHYTYVPRNMSKQGDYKVVVVPAIDARQARLDAQTYHIGWDAVEARMGQSRVMYDVLLKKRAPYIPGTPPVTRRIPKERPARQETPRTP